MKDFLVKYFKGNTAIRKALALILVVAVSIGFSSIDASAAKKVGINRKSASIYAGKTVQLKLTGTSIKSVKTSNKKVAIVSKKGLVKGLSAGKATITLTGKNKKSYKCTVNVVAYINKKAVSLYEGASYQLKLVGTGIKAVSTSRKAVATVTKAGKVTAKGAGKTVITLKGKNNKKYQCTVTVKKVTISATSKALALGKTFTLKLNGTGIKAASSNNTAVATVTKAGVVKGVKVGTAVITLKGNNNKTYTCKVTVTAAITGVEISTTTPVMGQTLVANLVPAGASNIKSYQWYRTKEADELMIKGENKSTYTVGAGDIGCSLYCVVTDKSGNKFYTKETSKITAVKITELKVTGMSGKKQETDKTATIAVVDDTLELVTDPDISADLLDIQWYRGSSKIAGATGKSYTLTGDDIGYPVSVKIEAKDDTIVKINSDATSADAGEVVDKVSNLTMKLSKTENIEVGDEITVSVKKGDWDITELGKVTYQWYTDSVSEETAIDLATSKTYKVKAKENGKKLICVVTGDYSEGYYGKFELSTGKATQKISAPAVYNDISGIGAAFAGTEFGVGNQLIAAFTTDKDTTATYQWLRDGSEISGATSAIYTFTAADAEGGAHKYQVVVKGTGAYTGEEKVVAAPATNATDDKLTISEKATLGGFRVYVGNETTPLVTTDEAVVHGGDVLTARTLPAAAVNSVEFTWTYQTAAGTGIATGSTFTVPEDITVFDTNEFLTVTAKYKGDLKDAFKIDSEDESNTYYLKKDGSTAPNTTLDATATLKVKPYRAIKSATLVYDNSAIGNVNATDYKSFTVPEVGVYAHAKVTPSIDATYSWYRDYKEGVSSPILTGAGEANYEIKAADIGHTLTCIVIADSVKAPSYTDAEAIATSTSKVKASSRTISAFKIVEAGSDIDTKEKFNNATSVTSMSAGNEYKVVALDSTGAVLKTEDTAYGKVLEGAKVTWDATKSTDYVSRFATWTAAAGKGIVTVTVTPNGKDYTGNAKSYTFKTEIAGESSTTSTSSKLGVAMESTYGTPYENASGTKTVDPSATIEVDFTGTSLGTVDQVKWYKSTTSATAGFQFEDGKTNLNHGTTENGAYYYAIVKDISGKAYETEVVKAENAKQTSLKPSGVQGAIDGWAAEEGAASEALEVTYDVMNQYGVKVAGAQTAATATCTVAVKKGDDACSWFTANVSAGILTISKVKTETTSAGGNITITVKDVAEGTPTIGTVNLTVNAAS